MALNNQDLFQKSIYTTAVRVTKFPIVHCAWSRLSVLYSDTKSLHPNLKVLCDALEDRAVMLCTVVLDTVSPVIIKLEPQISVANGIAWKGLDWLESAFPWRAPSEEDEMHNASATVGRVQHTVEGLYMDCHSSSVMQRAVTVAEAGLDQALNISEALVDRMLPPAEEEKERRDERGSEPTTLRTYPVRVLSISTKLFRRTYKAMEKLSKSPCQALRLQTHLSTYIYSLPQHLQQQAATIILFLSQMYTSNSPSSQTEGYRLSQMSPIHQNVLKDQWPESPTWQLQPTNDTESTRAEKPDGMDPSHEAPF